MTEPIHTGAIMAPGEMGQAVAAVVKHSGLRVITSLQGRSARTRALAEAAGVEADVLMPGTQRRIHASCSGWLKAHRRTGSPCSGSTRRAIALASVRAAMAEGGTLGTAAFGNARAISTRRATAPW
jgi:hypothetical protein